MRFKLAIRGKSPGPDGASYECWVVGRGPRCQRRNRISTRRGYSRLIGPTEPFITEPAMNRCRLLAPSNSPSSAAPRRRNFAHGIFPISRTIAVVLTSCTCLILFFAIHESGWCTERFSFRFTLLRIHLVPLCAQPRKQGSFTAPCLPMLPS